jgi:amidase
MIESAIDGGSRDRFDWFVPPPCQSSIRFLLLFCLAVILPGCALLPSRQSGSKDRAFISYHPPQPGDHRLRLAVKDLIDMKGEVTTAGSLYIANNAAPASEDAACMAIARERDVVIVGKTNLAEFAMGTTGINRHFGTPRNPLKGAWRVVPGGSSSGSGVAVASGAADVAFGTDTAGSIRVPAACCGIYGLKPTYGLVSLKGVFPLSPKHLDTVGPMAADVKRLVEGMALLDRGFDQKYRSEMAVHPSAKGLRVGRLRLSGTHAGIDRAIDAALERAGFQVIQLDERFAERWRQAHKDGTTVAVVDGWLSNGKYSKERSVSSLAKAAMLLGDIDYPREYEVALRQRAGWRLQLRDIFEKVDLIALPTLQSPPPRIPLLGATPLFEARMLNTQNTVAVNYAGLPAIAIPVPIENSQLPASLQLVGPRLSEAQLVNAARLVDASRQQAP